MRETKESNIKVQQNFKSNTNKSCGNIMDSTEITQNAQGTYL